MNKLLFSIISAVAILTGLGSAAGQAAPCATITASEVTGLLGSPIAQLPVHDPALQQAIDWIQLQQAKPENKLNSKPESTIGKGKEVEHRYIMGGPEVIPM